MNREPDSSPAVVIPRRRHALRIALGYAAAAALWILGSGWLLHRWVKDPDLAEHIEIYKGWLFVAVTALLLGVALNRYFRAIRQSHERLRENEAKFKGIVENALIPMGITKDDRVVFANQALSRLFGYETPEQFIGTRIADHTAPDSRPAFVVRFHRLQRGEPTEPMFTQKILRPNGEIRTVEGCATDFAIHGEKHSLTTFRDITERKQAEKALVESEENYRSIFNATSDALFIHDATGTILDANQRVREIYGYTREEVLTMNIGQLSAGVPPYSQTDAQDKIRQALTGSPQVFEWQCRRNNGELFWSEVALTASDIGGHLRVIALVRDITRRKRAEAAFQQSERNYREIFNSANEAIFVHDANTGAVLDVNDSMLRLFGCSRDEALRLTPDAGSQGISPYSATEARQWISKAVAEGPQVFEWQARKKSGELFWVEVALKSATISGQRRMLAVVRDITDRKRVEEDRSRLTAAIEQAAEAVVITDVKGDIVYANPAFEKSSGYTVAETLNQNPRLLRSGRHDVAFYRQMWQTLTRGQVWTGHLTNKRKDGTLYEEEATISPVRDAAGQIVGYIALKLDVTRQAQLERQLRQSQKMEAIGQLAGGIAHDFNNILTSFMMSLNMLQGSRKLDKVAREVLRDLEAGATRASNLTRQLLMYSRRSVLEIRALDLNEVVAGILKMLDRLLGEHIDLVFKPVSNLPAVKADAGMLEQVLLNLVVNARDAMPKGGKITITTQAVEIGLDRVTVHPDRREGRFVCLSVADTGCGMDEATLKRVFEPFFTTKEQGKGTGLGLATVYGIVAQHHGWLEAESRIGQGATFRVFLPAVAAAPATKESHGRQTIPGGHETLLVVEDEAGLRRNLVKALRDLGYRVLESANGPEALTLWKAHRRDIDLLLADMVMTRGMTGLELAEDLRKDKPGLRVIITSGYSEEIARNGIDTSAGMVYLGKPYPVSLLGQTVRDCLDGKTR